MSIAELIDSYSEKAKAIKEINPELKRVEFKDVRMAASQVKSYLPRAGEYKDFIRDHGLNQWQLMVYTEIMTLVFWSEKVK